MELEVYKPEPISLSKSPKVFQKGTKVSRALRTLEEGENLLVVDYYSNGLDLLKELKEHLGKSLPNKSFQEQRDFRKAYQELSNRVLIRVVDQQLAVQKSPKIGWLEKFYADHADFYLTFPQIQGLNSAWQWYKNGVSLPVLRNKLHPYFGVYFPSRYEHLQLFDNWLSRYEGPKKSAIDVGIGCGVLSLQLVKHKFQKVFGTDTNPNAIVGLKDFMGETKLSRKIELDHGNLFGKFDKPTELIVFNPPWLPKTHELNLLDEAIYYEEGLFPAFFEEAQKRLLPEGKLVLLFSNLAQLAGLSDTHPIEQELADGGRFKLVRNFTKSVKSASEKTKRDQHWRKEEKVELWELELI